MLCIEFNEAVVDELCPESLQVVLGETDGAVDADQFNEVESLGDLLAVIELLFKHFVLKLAPLYWFVVGQPLLDLIVNHSLYQL